MKTFIRVMKALSAPARIRILKLLQRRTCCVCEIKAAVGLAQPTVSRHLKVLENAGLVIGQHRGRWVDYRISDGSGNPYAAALLTSLQNWLNDDSQFNPPVA